MKINVVDTPGHADFGGEVERVLKMVDGVLLLVDSFEGPMPQTRFVLQQALALGLPVIIVINKMDRPDARCEEVYRRGVRPDDRPRRGREPARYPGRLRQRPRGHGDPLTRTSRAAICVRCLKPSFNTFPLRRVIRMPRRRCSSPPSTTTSSSAVSVLAASTRGTLKLNSMATRCDHLNPDLHENFRLSSLFAFEGLKRVPVESASMGEIVAVTGIEDIMIGDTICAPDAVDAAALCQDHRADCRHDLLRQRQPVCRP